MLKYIVRLSRLLGEADETSTSNRGREYLATQFIDTPVSL